MKSTIKIASCNEKTIRELIGPDALDDFINNQLGMCLFVPQNEREKWKRLIRDTQIDRGSIEEETILL